MLSVGNKPPQPVSVAVSGEGVFLLSRNCWEVVFIAPLFDITRYPLEAMMTCIPLLTLCFSMNVLPPVRVNESIAGDEDLDERFTLPLFSMNVNGMEVQLLSSAAAEIRRVVEAFCLEALSSVRILQMLYPCVL